MTGGELIDTGRHKYALPGLILLAAITVALVVMAYLPGMRAPFYLDDQLNIKWVPAIHMREMSLASAREVLRNSHMVTRPLPNLSLALNYLAGGLAPGGYHWANLIMHVAVGAALYWVLVLLAADTRSGGRSRSRVRYTALVVTALYLLHPLNIQAVTYVVQRMTVMAGLFSLVSFSCYLLARRSRSGRRWFWYVLSGLAWFCAVASKEIALQMPLVLLLYEWCYHRADWRHSLSRWSDRPASRRAAVGAAVIVAAVGLSLFRWYTTPEIFSWSEPFTGRQYSGFERILTQLRVQWFYVSLLAWPHPSRLNLEHDFLLSQSLFQPWTTGLALLGWLAVLVGALVVARRRPEFGFPVLAYLSLHLMESGPIKLEIVFEHRMYVPTLFLAMLLSNLLLALKGNSIRVYAPVVALTLPLAWMTYQRNITWSDHLTFLQDCAEKSPSHFRSWYNLGSNLGRAGKYGEAERALRRALTLQPQRETPNHAWARNQLGNVYLATGRRDMAVVQYGRGLEEDPDNPELRKNLRRILGYVPSLSSGNPAQEAESKDSE